MQSILILVRHLETFYEMLIIRRERKVKRSLKIFKRLCKSAVTRQTFST